MDENVDTTTVELESSPMTQSNALHGIPQLRRSVIKSLETGTLRNDDSLHFLRRVSKHTSYVITHKVSGFENYYFIILLGRKIEKQFPKEIQNKESEFNAERISKSVLQRGYYLKRKKRLEKTQQGSSHQNYNNSLETSNQKKFRYATHAERYAPTLPKDEETISYLDQEKLLVKTMYITNYVTNLSNRNEMDWNLIVR